MNDKEERGRLNRQGREIKRKSWGKAEKNKRRNNKKEGCREGKETRERKPGKKNTDVKGKEKENRGEGTMIKERREQKRRERK